MWDPVWCDARARSPEISNLNLIFQLTLVLGWYFLNNFRFFKKRIFREEGGFKSPALATGRCNNINLSAGFIWRVPVCQYYGSVAYRKYFAFTIFGNTHRNPAGVHQLNSLKNLPRPCSYHGVFLNICSCISIVANSIPHFWMFQIILTVVFGT